MPGSQFDAILNFQVAGGPEARLDRIGAHAHAAGESGHKALGGIGGSFDQATAGLARLFPALGEAGMRAGETAGALSDLATMALSPVGLAALGTATAVGGIGLAFGELGKVAVEVNAEIARSTRSIGAAINATYVFGREGHDHARNYASSMAFAGDVVGQLRERQMELGESMPVLAEGYLKMVPAAERAGLGTGAVMELMEKSTLAAKALGVSSEEAYFAVQGFMETGMARGEFLKQLGLAGEKFGQMGAKARYQAILERMGEMETAGREAATSVGTTWKTTWADIREEAGVAGKGMSDEVGSFVADFASFWKANKDTIITALHNIGDAGAAVFGKIRFVVGEAMQDFASVVHVLNSLPGAGRSGAQLGGYRAEGMIGNILPGYGFDEAKRGQTEWWDKLIEDVRMGKKKPAEARGIAEDFMKAIPAEDQWAMNIAIEQSQRLGKTKPLPAATINVNNTFTGDFHIRQDFKDTDPDRIVPIMTRDLTALAQQRRTSRFAPVFGM